jgi:hypothetical protein
LSKLSREIQTFVVQSVAAFDEPSVVAAAVKDEFGIAITRQAVETYDPTKFAGRDLAERWRELFWATRKAFLADTARIGISHRTVRLRALQRLASRAEDHGDLHLMLKVLDHAAREVADVYSQRRQIDGKQEDEATATRREALIKSILATQEETMAELRRNKERNTQVYEGEMPVRDE